MPTRIYEISVKYGIENKEVLAVAKSLGIAAAKVPSSSLDKITAEYLETELLKARPELVSKSQQQKPPVPSVSPTPSVQSTATLQQPVPPTPAAQVDRKPDNRFANPRMLQQIYTKLQGQANGRSYSPRAFENDVSLLLNDFFPFAVLPGIRLFSSEPRGRIAFGFEMDNLLHFRHQEIDYVVEVEVKHQPVVAERGRWTVKYDGASSCAREQVDNHIRTMWEYLRPIARQTELKFLAIVVSSELQTQRIKADGYRNAELYLCSIKDLPALLSERFNFDRLPNLPIPEVLRVPQSSFLDLLRLSLPVEQLGHPELASAIRYVDRCRRNLDETLFQKFDPSSARWVINGSAGMGKSVLLAYTAAVLSSGFELYRALGEVGVKRATETFAKIGFNPDPKRGSIAIMAMSAKQLDNIRSWFNLFVEQFQQADLAGDVRFRPPEFVLCRPGASILSLAQRCSALLVDEAHDIPPFAARDLAELHNKDGLYLVVACDRHQKLRLAGSDAKIIEGLDFSNKSTRLSQIYRNPAPVYIASLGLMFRWFAESGPKVIPSKQQLEEAFGFEVQLLSSGYEILMRSDAHPANSWCHTVASFPDAAAAYTALIKEKLGHREVLWVRFSEEDPDFDYEQLIKHFTYHNCRDRDAHKISDKYIKGQDYPIVVIEGFPGFMDRYVASANETAEAAEARAWAFRRELYLCASRATAFLYFICNVPESAEVLRIQGELQKLIEATATPERSNSGGTKSWRFLLTRTEQVRKVDVFADTITLPASNPGPQQPLQILESAPSPSAPPPSSEPLATKPTVAPSPSVIEPVLSMVPVGHPESTISVAAPEPINGVPAEVVTESTQPDAPTALNQPSGPSPAASNPPAVPSPAPFTPVLGETATLADVARHLGKPVEEVASRMASRGIRNVQPTSRVNVAFVTRLFNEPLPDRILASSIPQAVPRPQKSSPAQPIPTGVTQPPRSDRSTPQDAPNKGAKYDPRTGQLTISPAEPVKRTVLQVARNITVQNLATMLGVKTHVIVAELLSMKELRYAHQSMTETTLRKICARRGFDVLLVR